jgi:WD40 repeat protein
MRHRRRPWGAKDSTSRYAERPGAPGFADRLRARRGWCSGVSGRSDRQQSLVGRVMLCLVVSVLSWGALVPLTQAGMVASALGFGADSGKIAKLNYELKDDMAVTSLVWSSDGKYIATSSNQGKAIHVWDLARRERVHEFQTTAGTAYLHALSWSPDGRYLAACDGWHGGVRIYDARTWTEAHLLIPESDMGCRAMAFSSDGRELAVMGQSLSVYAVADWSRLKELGLFEGWGRGHLFRALAYLPGSHTILLGGQDHEVSGAQEYKSGHIWVFRTEETVPGREFAAYRLDAQGQPGMLISLAVSPDARKVAAGTMTGAGSPEFGLITSSVHILNIADGALLAAPLDGQPFGDQAGLGYTTDGRYLIVAHGGVIVSHVIHIIDAKSLQVVDLVHASNTIYDLAINPKSAQFAIGAGSRIAVWSLP